MNFLTIERVSNSFGIGYSIHATIQGYRFPEMTYYGYSKRNAEKLYRQEMTLSGKHLIKIDF